MDEILTGGIGNFGQIIKRDDTVTRPAGPYTASMHKFLDHLIEQGFDLVPKPIEMTDDVQLVSFVEGDVPEPPYEKWFFDDNILFELGSLLRRFHLASKTFQIDDTMIWQRDLADPNPSGIVCHNDALPGNVVFRDRKPVGLIDFDLAAPSSEIWDLSRAISIWTPLDDPDTAGAYGLGGLDPFTRLKACVDGYGLERSARHNLLEIVQHCNQTTEAYIHKQMSAGKDAYVKLWNNLDLGNRYAHRQEWIAAHKADLQKALR